MSGILVFCSGFAADRQTQKRKRIDVSAQKHLSNFHKSIQYNMYQCKICFEAWPLKGKVKSKTTYICHRCSK